MELKIWFRCAAVHDPVCPVLLRPALIGWEAKFRQIDLALEAPLKGEGRLVVLIEEEGIEGLKRVLQDRFGGEVDLES